jgi:hypothetical protein
MLIDNEKVVVHVHGSYFESYFKQYNFATYRVSEKVAI